MNSDNMTFTIEKFPIPPSVNGLYAHVRGRMVKTKAYRDYDRDVYKWITHNQVQLVGARNFVKGFTEKYVLNVDTRFYMNKKSIVCKSGKPKRNDTSNRIKALHDVLGSIILGVDDSYFWSGLFDKFSTEDGSEEYVQITMTLRVISAAAEA